MKKGFSIVELLVSIVLLSFISMMSLSLMNLISMCKEKTSDIKEEVLSYDEYTSLLVPTKNEFLTGKYIYSSYTVLLYNTKIIYIFYDKYLTVDTTRYEIKISKVYDIDNSVYAVYELCGNEYLIWMGNLK